MVKAKTKPTRTPRKSWRRMLPLGALVILLGGGGLGWSWWQSQIQPVQSPPTNAASKTFIDISIPEGTSVNGIGQILYKAKVIRSLTAWKLLTRFNAFGGGGAFQSGTYQLSPQDSLPAIASAIQTGNVKEDGFTIPEGWSVDEMAAAFEQKGWFTAAEFMAAIQSVDRSRYPWLPTDSPKLEGFLFPDTYQIPVDARTPEGVVQIMLDHFAKTALPIYEASPNRSQWDLNQWVTLASIIEKEAVVDSERPLIAGVFINRLEQGITLGSDPTVEYGLGIKQTKETPLTYAQVETPSPYNTYINAGLPPTPIASPGAASLKVALEPAQTDYLYFVARYDGTHVFSKTLGEHERAQTQIRDQIDNQQP